MKIPEMFKPGINFRSSAGEYAVIEEHFVFGMFFLSCSGFSVYILFFRPDIHGEVNALIRIFRILFPLGFGFGGLSLLGLRRSTTFDLVRGTFLWREMVFFNSKSREGGFADVKRVFFSSKPELYSAGGDSGQERYRWKIFMSLDLGDKVLLMAEWTRDIGDRTQNGGVEEDRVRAAELADFIGCPLVFPAERQGVKAGF